VPEYHGTPEHTNSHVSGAEPKNAVTEGGVDVKTGATTGALAGAVLGASGGPLGLLAGAALGGIVGGVMAVGPERPLHPSPWETRNEQLEEPHDQEQ
jgi:hypothetical protein